ncbi:hypothetical protein HHK36_010972 [Tetracentron sinense]|uniref:Homeobox domain-containing protein n=1 Tax=Tetracentron sinense TaxID=13715 RepID=A0A834ZBZ7_TETSI|nr:hypothetical protein HHK36_010972 [Tetracentron sinense]
MEDKNVEMSISGGSPASSRWNPTKEQISMLEGLYRQGIRTPSAEQIQQITTRLKEYGHIEGKNVFYWFQNHKARQRQKQKQESMVYLNRYLHEAAPIFASPPPPSNVVCSPFYLPQSGVGIYPHYTKVLLPCGIKRRERAAKMHNTKDGGAGYETTHPKYDIMQTQTGDMNEESSRNTINHETLALFPLHPTGILEDIISAENSNPPSSYDTTGIEEGSGDQPFFDFFAEPGSC